MQDNNFPGQYFSTLDRLGQLEKQKALQEYQESTQNRFDSNPPSGEFSYVLLGQGPIEIYELQITAMDALLERAMAMPAKTFDIIFSDKPAYLRQKSKLRELANFETASAGALVGMGILGSVLPPEMIEWFFDFLIPYLANPGIGKVGFYDVAILGIESLQAYQANQKEAGFIEEVFSHPIVGKDNMEKFFEPSIAEYADILKAGEHQKHQKFFAQRLKESYQLDPIAMYLIQKESLDLLLAITNDGKKGYANKACENLRAEIERLEYQYPILEEKYQNRKKLNGSEEGNIGHNDDNPKNLESWIMPGEVFNFIRSVKNECYVDSAGSLGRGKIKSFDELFPEVAPYFGTKIIDKTIKMVVTRKLQQILEYDPAKDPLGKVRKNIIEDIGTPSLQVSSSGKISVAQMLMGGMGVNKVSKMDHDVFMENAKKELAGDEGVLPHVLLTRAKLHSLAGIKIENEPEDGVRSFSNGLMHTNADGDPCLVQFNKYSTFRHEAKHVLDFMTLFAAPQIDYKLLREKHNGSLPFFREIAMGRESQAIKSGHSQSMQDLAALDHILHFKVAQNIYEGSECKKILGDQAYEDPQASLFTTRDIDKLFGNTEEDSDESGAYWGDMKEDARFAILEMLNDPNQPNPDPKLRSKYKNNVASVADKLFRLDYISSDAEGVAELVKEKLQGKYLPEKVDEIGTKIQKKLEGIGKDLAMNRSSERHNAYNVMSAQQQMGGYSAKEYRQEFFARIHQIKPELERSNDPLIKELDKKIASYNKNNIKFAQALMKSFGPNINYKLNYDKQNKKEQQSIRDLSQTTFITPAPQTINPSHFLGKAQVQTVDPSSKSINSGVDMARVDPSKTAITRPATKAGITSYLKRKSSVEKLTKSREESVKENRQK